MEVSNVLVEENLKIAKDTYKMTLTSHMASKMRAGQFVNIKIEGLMLRRPISISEVKGRQTFTIVYKVVGSGTEKLTTFKSGDNIDVFGPLGNFYPIHEDIDDIHIVGGGVGIPPMLELAKKYRKLRVEVHVVLGFGGIDEVFYEEEFKAIGCKVYVSTVDGSYGVKGTVIDAINDGGVKTDFVCCCGPVPMLKAIERIYSRGYMSFESRMACGMGACMACIAKDKKEENMYHRICKEGPVFPIGKVEY